MTSSFWIDKIQTGDLLRHYVELNLEGLQFGENTVLGNLSLFLTDQCILTQELQVRLSSSFVLVRHSPSVRYCFHITTLLVILRANKRLLKDSVNKPKSTVYSNCSNARDPCTEFTGQATFQNRWRSLERACKNHTWKHGPIR